MQNSACQKVPSTCEASTNRIDNVVVNPGSVLDDCMNHAHEIMKSWHEKRPGKFANSPEIELLVNQIIIDTNGVLQLKKRILRLQNSLRTRRTAETRKELLSMLTNTADISHDSLTLIAEVMCLAEISNLTNKFEQTNMKLDSMDKSALPDFDSKKFVNFLVLQNRKVFDCLKNIYELVPSIFEDSVLNQNRPTNLFVLGDNLNQSIRLQPEKLKLVGNVMIAPEDSGRCEQLSMNPRRRSHVHKWINGMLEHADGTLDNVVLESAGLSHEPLSSFDGAVGPHQPLVAHIEMHGEEPNRSLPVIEVDVADASAKVNKKVLKLRSNVPSHDASSYSKSTTSPRTPTIRRGQVVRNLWRTAADSAGNQNSNQQGQSVVRNLLFPPTPGRGYNDKSKSPGAQKNSTPTRTPRKSLSKRVLMRPSSLSPTFYETFRNLPQMSYFSSPIRDDAPSPFADLRQILVDTQWTEPATSFEPSEGDLTKVQRELQVRREMLNEYKTNLKLTVNELRSRGVAEGIIFNAVKELQRRFAVKNKFRMNPEGFEEAVRKFHARGSDRTPFDPEIREDQLLSQSKRSQMDRQLGSIKNIFEEPITTKSLEDQQACHRVPLPNRSLDSESPCKATTPVSIPFDGQNTFECDVKKAQRAKQAALRRLRESQMKENLMIEEFQSMGVAESYIVNAVRDLRRTFGIAENNISHPERVQNVIDELDEDMPDAWVSVVPEDQLLEPSDRTRFDREVMGDIRNIFEDQQDRSINAENPCERPAPTSVPYDGDNTLERKFEEVRAKKAAEKRMHESVKKENLMIRELQSLGVSEGLIANAVMELRQAFDDAEWAILHPERVENVSGGFDEDVPNAWVSVVPEDQLLEPSERIRFDREVLGDIRNICEVQQDRSLNAENPCERPAPSSVPFDADNTLDRKVKERRAKKAAQKRMHESVKKENLMIKNLRSRGISEKYIEDAVMDLRRAFDKAEWAILHPERVANVTDEDMAEALNPAVGFNREGLSDVRNVFGKPTTMEPLEEQQACYRPGPSDRSMITENPREVSIPFYGENTFDLQVYDDERWDALQVQDRHRTGAGNETKMPNDEHNNSEHIGRTHF